VTLKLVPRPEQRAIVTNSFTRLTDCVAAARKVLASSLPLVTLMAENRMDETGKQGWTLLAGIAGSTPLVLSCQDRLARLMQADSLGGISPTIFGPEREPDFRREFADRRKAFSEILVRGRGNRRPLFAMLEQRAGLLDRFASDQAGRLRIELDFGYPSMTISGKKSSGIVRATSGLDGLFPDGFCFKEADTGIGFYEGSPGKGTTGALYARLNPLLTGNRKGGCNG